jgi:DNA-binding CsgD family transcriptional regulator
LLAAGAFGLQWLDFQFVVRTHATETYLVLIALAFLGLGVWVGARLFRRPPAGPFEPNLKVRETLGVSDREFEVLTLLAEGRSNKEIANQLNVSPNTVKTHVARLFEKLEASRRTEAILRARELGMIR